MCEGEWKVTDLTIRVIPEDVLNGSTEGLHSNSNNKFSIRIQLLWSDTTTWIMQIDTCTHMLLQGMDKIISFHSTQIYNTYPKEKDMQEIYNLFIYHALKPE